MEWLGLYLLKHAASRGHHRGTKTFTYLLIILWKSFTINELIILIASLTHRSPSNTQTLPLDYFTSYSNTFSRHSVATVERTTI
ncbi:hypothetical protein K432DRAFT_51553 [Lepidopterella palustris CBS 459.81]|uniref:Uncharacterized protein n=1 Tax=Lepidopterella palustris CBS 459.81 TaxID=1314670 RepID=A0A8E2JF28_9PEZI|nr:hypothetical protein K432DRAFT_51553 [Lepidopterella palustris CBS 459.81]